MADNSNYKNSSDVTLRGCTLIQISFGDEIKFAYFVAKDSPKVIVF